MPESVLRKRDYFLWIALSVAAIVYALISFVNHYCFRTYSLDLGAYTNAMYDYAHFRTNDSLAFKSTAENLLADHFDLYLPLFSPLTYIFGTYTLLVVQLLAVLFGGLGIYRLINSWFPNQLTHRFALLYFLLFFGIYAAFSFDYHSNVVGSMFVPWLFLAFERKKRMAVVLWTILLVIGKENMALWLLFISLGLAYLYRKDQLRFRWALAISVFSIGYFAAVIGWIMPSFSTTGVYPHFHYSILGKNASEAVFFLLKHPVTALHDLFVNHTGDVTNDYIKLEFWVLFLISGVFCLFRPVYLFMLIPIFGQKLFHDYSVTWGVIQQYCIEFAPILTIGTFAFIGEQQRKSNRVWLGYIAVFLTLGTTIRLMDNTVSYYEKARLRIYKSAHYNREFPMKEAYALMNCIPDDAKVAAQSVLVPHLALRDKIYTFPDIGDAEYLMLLPSENPYPAKQEAFDLQFQTVMKDTSWLVLKKDQYFVLLKKIRP